MRCCWRRDELASVRFNAGLLDFRTAGLRLRATLLLGNTRCSEKEPATFNGNVAVG
jgi:hypothetical protein